MYLVMTRTGGPGPKGISAFLVEKVKATSSLRSLAKRLCLAWHEQLPGLEPACNDPCT